MKLLSTPKPSTKKKYTIPSSRRGWKSREEEQDTDKYGTSTLPRPIQHKQQEAKKELSK
jgi:hypothetical protein